MRTVRRHDLAPRVEMLPLIDVVFLLLTFFVYSLVVMVHAQILPVKLSPVPTGQRADPHPIHAITIDHLGQVHLDRQPVALADLPDRLRALPTTPDGPPRLFVALEDRGDVDRGPLVIQVTQALRQAGFDRFTFVGQPEQ